MSTSLALPTKTLDQALSEVEARFLFNLPEEELNSPERLFFQIEQAFWYYEDFKADRFTNLPHFGTLKSFAQKMFQHCELLSSKNQSFQELFADYASYKSKIPVCGCIMLNPTMTKVVLVCDWSGKSWMFPRGKINQNETELQCAIRETQEETGYNAAPHCTEDDFLVTFHDQKKVQLYIARDVKEDTVFECQTRKEISEISFHPLDALPARTFHVHPFIPGLKRWIAQQRKAKNNNTPVTALQSSKVMLLKRGETLAAKKQAIAEAAATKKQDKKKKNSENPTLPVKLTPSSLTEAEKKKTTTTSKQANKEKNAFDMRNGETFSANEAKRWSVQDMFSANAKITGRDYDYDGNPHAFGSFHPRYVNYTQSDGSSAALVKNELDGQELRKQLSREFLEFSMQSHRDGQKMLRGVDFDENELHSQGQQRQAAVSHEKAVSSFSQRPLPVLFSRPFLIQKSEVMAAIDSALRAHPVTMM